MHLKVINTVIWGNTKKKEIYNYGKEGVIFCIVL